MVKTRRGTSLGRTLPPAKRRRILAAKTTPAPADQPEKPPPRCFASTDIDRVLYISLQQRARSSRRPVASTAALVRLLAELVLPVTPRRQRRARTAKNTYLLQDGTEKVVSKEMIQEFADDEAQRRFALLHDVFKIGMDAPDAEQVADQDILGFFQGKTLTAGALRPLSGAQQLH